MQHLNPQYNPTDSNSMEHMNTTLIYHLHDNFYGSVDSQKSTNHSVPQDTQTIKQNLQQPGPRPHPKQSPQHQALSQSRCDVDISNDNVPRLRLHRNQAGGGGEARTRLEKRAAVSLSSTLTMKLWDRADSARSPRGRAARCFSTCNQPPATVPPIHTTIPIVLKTHRLPRADQMETPG